MLLDAEPDTDWTKVDIEALRRHLVDMNNVTLRAEIAAEPVANGLSFTVTGPADLSSSIRQRLQHADIAARGSAQPDSSASAAALRPFRLHCRERQSCSSPTAPPTK